MNHLHDEQLNIVLATSEAKAPEVTASPETIAQFKKRLGSWKRREREQALREILSMGEIGLDLLFKLMNERRIPSEVMKRRGAEIAVIVAAFSLIVSQLLAGLFGKNNTLGSLSMMFGLGASFIYQFVAAPKYHRCLVQALGKTSDVRAIPHLLEALSGTGLAWSDRDAARGALLRLLPLVQFKHINLFANEGRTRLHHLAKGHDSRLQIAALNALPQVGDVSSIEVVQEIVRHPELYHYSPELREAAGRCLEYLKTHASRVENAQTLLRASQYTDRRDELLRPAYHTDDAPANELLRPESKPGNE